MKICPTCRKTYDDDSLNFCLDDGSVLNFSAYDAAAPTIVMNPARPTHPPPGVGVQAGWDAQPGGAYPVQPGKKSRAWLWALAVLGLAVLLCGGGVAGLFVYVASVANTDIAANSSKGTSSNGSNRANTFSSSSRTPEPSRTEPAGDVTSIDLATLTRPNSVYGNTDFADGELLVSAKQKGYYYVLVTPDRYKTDRSRTRVTVRNPDVADSELGYGLVFHSDTEPLVKDYAFLIDSKRRRFRVVRHEPNDEVTVRPWTSSDLINQGAMENVLEAYDKGNIIELNINGRLATTIDNKKGPAGGVPGFYSGDGVKIGFKKLEIIK